MGGALSRLIGQGAEGLPLGGAARKALGPGLPHTSLLDSIKAATAQTTLPLADTPETVTGRQVGTPDEYQSQLAAMNRFNPGGSATIRPAEEAFPGEKVTTMAPEAAEYFEPGRTMSMSERARMVLPVDAQPTGNEVKVVERIGDPARPFHSQFLRTREGTPVVHRIKVTKTGENVLTDEAARAKLGISEDEWTFLDPRERHRAKRAEWPIVPGVVGRPAFRQAYPLSIETSYGHVSEILAGDILDFTGDITGKSGIGVKGWDRRYEVMPDGSLIRFSRGSSQVETFYYIDKKTNQLVLKEPDKVIDGWMPAPRRETSPYGDDLIDVEKAATEPFTDAQREIAMRLGIDPEEVGMSVISAGRAQALRQRQRQEAGPGMLGKRGVDTSRFYSNIKEGETMGNTQHTRIARGPAQIKGRLRLANTISNYELDWFRRLVRTQPYDLAHYSTRDAAVIKRWNEMAKMSGSVFDEQKRLALALLDVMPDEFIDGLALSIKNTIPGAKPGTVIAGQYRYDGAAGILTLASNSADLQTFYHEFFHHLHTWIAPEHLLSVSQDWKRALMAADTQNLISTLYWGHYQRIKTQRDLLVLIQNNNDLRAEWNRITSYWTPNTDTEQDWLNIIARMQDMGMLPADFRKAEAPTRPLLGGPVSGPRSTLYSSYPSKQALSELKSLAYRYTNPSEFLAETFGNHTMIALMARDLKSQGSRNTLNQILDLLREWVVMAYNFAVRAGRKSTAARLFEEITSGKYRPIDDEYVQQALREDLADVYWQGGMGGALTDEEKAVIDATEGYPGAWRDVPMSAVREVRGAKYGPQSSRMGAAGYFSGRYQDRGVEQKSMGGGPFAETPEGLPAKGWNLIDSSTHQEMVEMLSKRRAEWKTAVRGMPSDEPLQGPTAGLWQSPSRLEPRFPGMPESVTSENIGEFLRNPEAFVRQQEFGPKVTNVPSKYTTNPPGTAPQIPRGTSEQMKQNIWNDWRARQGPITVYTGADEPFTRFDMERIGKRDPRGEGKTVSDPGFFGRGAYTTTDYEKANRWSYGSGNVMATVIPPDAKFLRITSIDELYNKWGMQRLTEKEKEISSTLRTPEGFPTVESQAAYKKAIDTWTDKMIKDGWDGVELVSKTDREFVLFHPEKYEFDPQTGGAPDSPGTAPQMRAEGGGDEPWNYLGKTPEDKSEELVDYQLGNLETMVYADIWGAQASDAGATYRYMLEGAGDAFREIVGNGAPDYIEEKVRRILRQFNERPQDLRNLPSEAVASGEKMKEIALAAPVTTPRQKAGVDLIVAVIDRNVEAIKDAAARIRGQQ